MKSRYLKAPQKAGHVPLSVIIIAIICLVASLWAGLTNAQALASEQAALSLRHSVLAAAAQCAAVEGAYPLSLTYLEDTYGLTINHDAYDVFYEAYATNVAPHVVVKPK